MSEKPDVGNGCVSSFVHQKKFLTSVLAEFGGKLFGKCGDKIKWKQVRRETRWLSVP
jgi:hypothetical protein